MELYEDEDVSEVDEEVAEEIFSDVLEDAPVPRQCSAMWCPNHKTLEVVVYFDSETQTVTLACGNVRGIALSPKG